MSSTIQEPDVYQIEGERALEGISPPTGIMSEEEFASFRKHMESKGYTLWPGTEDGQVGPFPLYRTDAYGESHLTGTGFQSFIRQENGIHYRYNVELVMPKKESNQ